MKITDLNNKFDDIEAIGSVLVFYHRTPSYENALGIIRSGYRPASHRQETFFGSYKLNTVLGLDNKTGADYGDFIVRCFIDLEKINAITCDPMIKEKFKNVTLVHSNEILRKKPKDIIAKGFNASIINAGGDGNTIIVLGDAIPTVTYDPTIYVEIPGTDYPIGIKPY